MPLLELDPSLAVGLLCRTASSFDALCDACHTLTARCLAPFSITETPPRIPSELYERAETRPSCGDDDEDLQEEDELRETREAALASTLEEHRLREQRQSAVEGMV